MIKSVSNYYQLAKPGIIYGNLLTAVAGFFCACRVWHAGSVGLFVALVFGTMCVIGSACVFNNYEDRGIDAKMDRTKNRSLVDGSISGRNALVYASILGVFGFVLIFVWVNALAGLLELFGFFSYVVLYGVAKRRTSSGVIVGSIPGAIPIVAGYCAISGRFDAAALILFIILVLWQMPHFYGIALYREEEYRAAGVPVLPAVKGIRWTKIEMLAYTILFFAATMSLVWLGFAGWVYGMVMACSCIVWIGLAVRGFSSKKSAAAWGRSMFLFSLIIIVIFSVIVSIP